MKTRRILVGAFLCLFHFLNAPRAEAAKHVGNVVWKDLDEKKALVYVIRDWAFGASVRTTFLFVDERLAATIDNDTYAAFYVEPGDRSLVIGLSDLRVVIFPMYLEAGREYYLQWKLNRGQLVSLDEETGRRMVREVEDLVEPTEAEYQTGAEMMKELKEPITYAWSPEMTGLVDALGDRLGEVKPRTVEAIRGIVKGNLAAYEIPPGSLGYSVVLAELADLGANVCIEEGDFDNARELLRTAVSGYAVAAERFDDLRKEQRRKKWQRFIAVSLVQMASANAGRTVILDDGRTFAARSMQQRRHLQQAEDARKFGREAERRLACLEKGGGPNLVLPCLEMPAQGARGKKEGRNGR